MFSNKHFNNLFSAFPICVEYAQPLVTGTMASLGQRSTFKPEEADAPEYDAPIPPEHYHAYAEPLPASGTEYATPIMIDRANHLSGGTLPFRGRGLVARTDSSQSASSAYDTPKNTSDQATPTEGQLYQVPQNTHNAPCQKKDWPIAEERTLLEAYGWTLPFPEICRSDQNVPSQIVRRASPITEITHRNVRRERTAEISLHYCVLWVFCVFIRLNVCVRVRICDCALLSNCESLDICAFFWELRCIRLDRSL